MKKMNELQVGDTVYIFADWRGNRIFDARVTDIKKYPDSMCYTIRGNKAAAYLVLKDGFGNGDFIWQKDWVKNVHLFSTDKDTAKREVRAYYAEEIAKLQKKMKRIRIEKYPENLVDNWTV